MSPPLREMTIRGLRFTWPRHPRKALIPSCSRQKFVLVAQTIVSRQIDPQRPAVAYCWDVPLAGPSNNVIPDEVKLGLSLRTYSQDLQDQIIADIRRTANGLAEAYGVPADRLPIVTVLGTGPVTVNDDAMAERLRQTAVSALGKDHVEQARAIMASEDVG